MRYFVCDYRKTDKSFNSEIKDNNCEICCNNQSISGLLAFKKEIWRFGTSREIWHSPVIQATWEARTVGWLETERSLPPGE